MVRLLCAPATQLCCNSDALILTNGGAWCRRENLTRYARGDRQQRPFGKTAAGRGFRVASARPRRGASASCLAESSRRKADPLLEEGVEKENGIFRVASLAAIALCMSDAQAAFATDNILVRDFDVTFYGFVVDHKVLIETIVLGQFVGFIGALGGGWQARARKEEVESLNSRLVQVNKQLRAQALILQHEAAEASSPVRLPESEQKKSVEQLQKMEEIFGLLIAGKEQLKAKNPTVARDHFNASLKLIEMHSNALDSPWKAERKALRGLGAACEQQGQRTKALEYMLRVLQMCETHGEMVGKSEALGVIADLYTDMGELESAAVYYDKYIESMRNGSG